MGDLGYFDENGRLWFCGRKAERVETEQAIYYSDCCEGVFNRLPNVYRSALVALSREGSVCPAIVVEPISGAFPKTEAERVSFVASLKAAGAESPVTRSIEFFFFEKSFPVDVRHNAKIHRLKLAKRIANR